MDKDKEEIKNGDNVQVAEKSKNPFHTEILNVDAATASAPSVINVETVLTGEVLKRERLKKGIDIATVSKALCIRGVYIEAIEKNDYNTLPEEPYTLGFVKSYADYLSLSSSKIVSAYKKEMMAYVYHQLPAKELDDLGVVSNMMPRLWMILVALLIGIIVYLVWYAIMSRFDTEEDGKTPVAEIKAVIVSDSDNVNAVDKKQNAGDLADSLLIASLEKTNLNDVLVNNNIENTDKQVKKAPKKSRIMLKAVEDTWVKIAKGNEVLRKGIMKKGEVFNVPGTENDEIVMLDTGNAAGIEAYVDKRPIGKLGKRSEVKHGFILDAASLINKKGL